MITPKNNGTIRELLEKKINSGIGGFAAYLMLGYPDYETSVESMIEAAKNGADIIEIGIPFSDPIADGPIIQHAGNLAIKNNTQPSDAWKAVREIKKRTKALPLVMTYANIPMQYGFDDFAKDAYQAGVRGIILPDVPPELFPEELESLDPIFLVSPLTQPERLDLLIKKSNGFIYLVSNLGITGEQRSYDRRLIGLIDYIKKVDPNIPKLLGFGIHDKESTNEALRFGMDGVIVGSALIKALGDNGDITKMTSLVQDIAKGLYS